MDGIERHAPRPDPGLGASSAAQAAPAATADDVVLRIITCGSVDDGKSTLIGRLLHDTGALPDDLREQWLREAAARPAPGGGVDYSLLVDGLAAEREQGITIDVAYRYLSTGRRRLIIADCPGHEQYTRNMATGASQADVAVVLIDARKGIVPQTRRHSRIVRLFGIRQVVLTVNKMDLVDWSEARFRALETAYRDWARSIGIEQVHAIPLSARYGDNLIDPSPHTPWYRGRSLLSTLETLSVAGHARRVPLRFSVQSVVRPEAERRVILGSLAAGRLAVGQRVRVLPDGPEASVRQLWVAGRPRPSAGAGDAVAVELSEAIDVGRGAWLVDPAAAPSCSRRIRADLLWLHEEALRGGQSLLLQLGHRTVAAQIAAIEHVLDVHSGAEHPAATLPPNGIGRVELCLAQALPVATFAHEPALGAFILVDRRRDDTLAAGTIVETIAPDSAGADPLPTRIGPELRAAAKLQTARCIWFTGPSGAGKSTLAEALERRLYASGHHTMLLDGDALRGGLCRDLGYGSADRAEQTRRLGEVARLMVEAGLIVLVSSIAPQRAARAAVRARFAPGLYVEVYVAASRATRSRRDPKGLYARAARGALPDPIGVVGGYEPPLAPELVLDTDHDPPIEALVQRVVDYLETHRPAERASTMPPAVEEVAGMPAVGAPCARGAE